MEQYLSDRIKSLPASATLAMTAKARELKNAGRDIISLSVGEPDFGTPDYIQEAAIEAIKAGTFSGYTPVDGYAELKEAICLKFKRDNNIEYKPSQIVVSTGAKQSLANLTQVLLNEGDEILLPAPYWVSYSAQGILAGATYAEIPTTIENDFKITPEQLEAAITPKTKLIFFNSPNNPSGTVYTEEDYKALAAVLEKYPEIFIISDEIYEHISYGEKNFSIASIPSMYDRTITVNGLAKAFAMTGWRIGYIGAPEWIAKACTKLQGQVTSGTNSIAQRAAITALTEPVERIGYMVEAFQKRRDLMLEWLGEIEGLKINEPKGAFYIFPDVSVFFGKEIKGEKIENATDFALFILEHAGVATVSGDAFGAPNCIRISYAASEEQLKKAVNKIKEALA